ncbi:MAG TPA: SelB C-terminal domain-containing protein [Thermomicrobiales bacterium]|nr:SelB C-terminal domain-containing protein [Thermomicrobiales bacterium]
MPAGDLEAGAQIARVLQQARFTPPDAEALATTRKEPPRRTLALLALLVERGDVVRITDRIWMHRDAVEESKQIALKLFRAAPTFSTMAFRDALGVSRKFAVPLVDYLDRIRFTARSGNQRRPGSEAKKLLEPVVTP